MTKTRKDMLIDEFIDNQVYWRPGTPNKVKEVYGFLIQSLCHEGAINIIETISSAACEKYGD